MPPLVLTPVTTPDEFTLAMAGALLDQDPPATVELSEVVNPGQTLEMPEIVPAKGAAVMLTGKLVVAVPQLFT